MSISEKELIISNNNVIIAENEQKIYNKGYDTGYKAGEEAEYNEFWDGFLNVVNGVPQRTQYNMAFYQWRHKYIRPKYIIMPDSSLTTVDQMYNSCNNLLEIGNVDFSNFTPKTTTSSGSWYYTFGNCTQIKIFPDFNMKAGGYCHTWRNCLNLETIEIMRCCEEGKYTTPFYACKKLKNLTIDGIIGTSFPIPDSPLTTESIRSIIFHLKNYNGDTSNEYKNILTIKSSAFEALEEEGFTEEDKIWLEENEIIYSEDLTWGIVIDDLKWNLTLA